MDRFMLVEAHYPEVKVEEKLLNDCFPSIPKNIATKMVEYANEVRKLFLGEFTSSTELNNLISNSCEVTLSTRTLLRWADLTVRFKPLAQQGIQPVSYALDRALGFRASKESRAMLHELAQRIFKVQDESLDDIVKTADETWRKVYEGKDSVTHKALSPLKTLEQKLKGLSFIEPHVSPVAQMIEESLARVPKKGNIVGSDLVALQGLVCLMRDKKTLVSHAQKLMNGQSLDSLLNNLLGVNNVLIIISKNWIKETRKKKMNNKTTENMAKAQNPKVRHHRNKCGSDSFSCELKILY